MTAVLAVDLKFMQRTLRLAAEGRGRVEPNPMVGCVLVRQDQILAQARHEVFGGPHAEARALAMCSESPAGSTAYVNLEPCCHTAKKTPPCVPALIDAGIRRVVVGCADPNPQVAGRGIQRLREAGIDVLAGVLEAESRQLNAAFFATITLGAPYVTLKWAQSADGKVAASPGRRTSISNTVSNRIVHELRSRCDAIMVGISTVMADDPILTAHLPAPFRRPMRVVLDTHLRLPLNSRLVQTAHETPLRVYCEDKATRDRRSHVEALRAAGVQIGLVGQSADGRLSLPQILADLGRLGVVHVLVEPGPTLATEMIDQNLADRVWVFRSPVALNEPAALPAPTVSWPSIAELDLDGDRLTEQLNPRSSVYFAPVASADFQLAVQSAGTPKNSTL